MLCACSGSVFQHYILCGLLISHKISSIQVSQHCWQCKSKGIRINSPFRSKKKLEVEKAASTFFIDVCLSYRFTVSYSQHKLQVKVNRKGIDAFLSCQTYVEITSCQLRKSYICLLYVFGFPLLVQWIEHALKQVANCRKSSNNGS